MDTARSCVRDTQVFHLSKSAAHSSSNAEGRQDFARMGLEHREEAADGTAGEKAEGREIGWCWS